MFRTPTDEEGNPNKYDEKITVADIRKETITKDID